MVTAFTAQLDEITMKIIRPNKQVPLNVAELAPYIDAITSRVRDNSLELRNHAQELDPPYPLEEALTLYHVSEIEIVCHSALLKILADMKSISSREWAVCADVYANFKSISADNANRYEGIKSPAFSSEMLELVERIGAYLKTLDVKFQYLSRGDTVNARPVVSLAIIWLGRKLIQEKAIADETAN